MVSWKKKHKMFLKYSFNREYVQMICVFFASLSLLSDGMQMSWPAPSMSLMMRKDSPFKIEKEDTVWLEMITPTSIILALPFICLGDKLGRRLLIIFSSFLGLVAWFLIAIGNRKGFLFIARSLAGAATAVSFVCSPMYITEIADKKIRGSTVSFFYVMFHIGVILMYTITPNTSLRIPPIIGMSLLSIEFVAMPFFSESPYYHISRKNEDAAKRSLIFFQGENCTEEKLASMKTELTEQNNKAGCKDLFRTGKKKFLIILIFINAAQPATGYLALLMNINSILEYGGVTSLSPYVVAVVYSSIMLVSTVISMLLVDRLGRRFLIVVSIFFTSVSLLILAVFFHLKYLEFNLNTMTCIPIIAINAYALFHKLGLGTVATVLAPEVCPPEFRTIGMAIGFLFYNISSLASIYFYHYTLEKYGLFAVFYSFSFLSILSFLISYILIPETKGKTLRDIQVMLEN